MTIRTDPSRRRSSAMATTSPGREASEAMGDFLHLVPLLYARLRAFTQSLHGEGELSGARRGVLQSLASAPATVPQLARARPVARQVMQKLVDELAMEGAVEFAQNPHHRRSKLIRLTRAGERRLAEMRKRERATDLTRKAGLSSAEVRTAAKVCQQLIDLLG
jgi:DNA-binding MarR family transcriptional regulator